MNDIPQIPAAEVHRRLEDGEALCVLDVREGFELEIARIEGALHVPMAEIPGRLVELPRDLPILVLCHHGVRSQHVAQWLSAQGFEGVGNVSGGIDAWAETVDRTVPRYR